MVDTCGRGSKFNRREEANVGTNVEEEPLGFGPYGLSVDKADDPFHIVR
jgi:hypothetical protein